MHKCSFYPDCGVLAHLRMDQLNQIYEQGGDFTCNINDINIDYEFMGQDGLSTKASMFQIENVIKTTGWLELPVDGLPEVDIELVVLNVFQDAT